MPESLSAMLAATMVRVDRIVLFCLLSGGLVHGQRSDRDRPQPSPQAARAGSAVQWRPSVEAAVEESRRSQKPVLWYVPTVQGSPMDRKAEIDRYLLAGPWSHPEVVALVNTGFVPVRQVARGALARDHQLQPGKFIEPGFVVLDPQGKVSARVDRLTTIYPQWFLARLTPWAAVKPAPRNLPDPLRSAWNCYAAGDFAGALAALPPLDDQGLTPDWLAEAGFLRGACWQRTQQGDRAREVWQQTAAAWPEQPWAWKCAAESEGHGPFARGFEDFLALPAGALDDGPGSGAPPGVYDEAQLRAAGTRYLTSNQQPDGSYRDSRYDFGGQDSMPNVYTAITAIVGLALLHEVDHPPAEDDPRERALQRALAFVLDDTSLALQDSDEIIWAHAYRVLLLARWLELRPQDQERLRPPLARVTQALEALQPADGAWYHEYPNPFATATALIALAAAQRAGVKVDSDRIARGVNALTRCRAKSGGFSYYQVQRGAASAGVRASACRMPTCELALALWAEPADPSRLVSALTAFFEHHAVLEAVRKYDDHANGEGHGGFFYWYDLVGAAWAIAAVEDGAQRAAFHAQLHAIVLSLPEFDGCFVDSHELGKAYGTASALWCLAILRGA